MRKSEREITSREEIEEVLRASTILRLAMVDGDRPYIIPVNFGYENGRIWFHCAKEGKKLDLIAINPRVAFEVESDVEIISAEVACGWTVNFRSVVGTGVAHLITDEAEKLRGLDALMAHHGGPVGEYRPKAVEKAAIVRIDIEEMTGKKKL